MKDRAERSEVRGEKKEFSTHISHLSPLSSGTLYIVATPIGNLEDITLRALRILKEVDFILCEDKRVTVKLLNKYQIKTKLISFHKFNESKNINYILSVLYQGKNIALLSDAGTPLISDPGSSLLSTLSKGNIKTISIPGPSALSSALSLCPFGLSDFLFVGFLPPKKMERDKLLRSLNQRSKNIVLFIAPHDIENYLQEIYDLYPEINVFYARELTKIYEETWSGEIKDLIFQLNKKKLKGEIVLILNFEEDSQSQHLDEKRILKEISQRISKGYSLKETTKALAKELDLSSNKLYEIYVKNK